MRSHRVILRQIEELGLDPSVPHVTGKDGNLVPKTAVVVEEPVPQVQDEKVQLPTDTEIKIEKKPKANPFKKKVPVTTPVTE